jgi:Mannosyltransferase (PIG-V)
VTPRPQATKQIVWRALWTSRLVVLFSGVAGVIQLGVANGAAAYDPGKLMAPFGYLGNAVVAPLARWDSGWYLMIAKSGYADNLTRMAFFPVYPGLIHIVGFATRSDLIAGVVISLVAFAVALALLHRLVLLDFDEDVAETTVMLVAFCPVAFFFSAVYTESLFLALSVGAIYAARRERWLAAGLLGGIAAATRNGGVALILPVAVIYFYGPRTTGNARRTRWAGQALSGGRRLLPRYRLRADAVWMLLIPAGLSAYLAYLGIKYGQALAPFHAEAAWYRHSTMPWTTVWQAANQAWDGLRQLIHGPARPYYVWGYTQSVISAALHFGLRRLPVAYSLYTLAMLVLALVDPVSLQPLASLPRYELVVFPLFIWGAQMLTRRHLTLAALAALAVLLGLFTVEFATWRWVA